MGLSLLERYIFRKALIALLTTAFALIGVVWIVRAVQQVDVILNKGQGILTYLQMTTLGVPTLVAAIAPLALLIGLLQTINVLNNDSELVVMHASGASRLTLLKPFITLALAISITVYALALFVGPASMSKLRSMVNDVRADLVSIIVREGAFQDITRGLTFHIAGRAPGGVLKGVFILDGREEAETFTYLAREGVIQQINDQSFMLLRDGEIHRLNHETNEMSVVKYQSYAFDLSSLSGRAPKDAIYSQNEIPTIALLFPDTDEPFFRRFPERYRAEFHIRATSGLWPLVTGLIVLVFVGNPSSHRQGQMLAVASAAGAVVGLRAVSIIFEGMLRDVPMAAIAVWLLPLGTMAVCAIYLSTDRSPVSRRIQSDFESRVDALLAFIVKLRGMTRGADGVRA